MLTIRLSGLPPLTFGGVGGVTPLGTGPGTPIQEATSAFGPSSLDLPDTLFTGVPQISDLRITGILKPVTLRTFSAGQGFGGGFGGTAGLGGSATICVFACAGIQVAIPLTIVGVGGTLYSTALFQPLTVIAQSGWTTGAAQITGINTEIVSFAGNTCAPVTCPITTLGLGTGIGVYVSTVTLSGFDNRTVGGGGVVQLVNPVLTLSLAGALPLFAVQTLTFLPMPEPGTLLLLGSGIAGLVALGRRRMQK